MRKRWWKSRSCFNSKKIADENSVCRYTNTRMMTFPFDSKSHTQVSTDLIQIQYYVLISYLELKQVSVLSCDFTHIPIAQFPREQTPGSMRYYYAAYCQCRMQLDAQSLLVQVIWDDTELCSATVELK
jgi:hypothetical protein